MTVLPRSRLEDAEFRRWIQTHERAWHRWPPMDHIGIDVHERESQICILTEDGELIESRVGTEARQFAEVLGTGPRARILIESATESEWNPRARSRPCLVPASPG